MQELYFHAASKRALKTACASTGGIAFKARVSRSNRVGSHKSRPFRAATVQLICSALHRIAQGKASEGFIATRVYDQQASGTSNNLAPFCRGSLEWATPFRVPGAQRVCAPPRQQAASRIYTACSISANSADTPA